MSGRDPREPAVAIRVIRLNALTLKRGDGFPPGNWPGDEAQLDDEELMVAKEADTMGVVERAPTKKKGA